MMRDMLHTVSVELALHSMGTDGAKSNAHGSGKAGKGVEHVVDHLERACKIECAWELGVVRVGKWCLTRRK